MYVWLLCLKCNIFHKKNVNMCLAVIGQKWTIYEQSRHIEHVKRIKVNSTDISSIDSGTLILHNKTNFKKSK